MQPDLPLLALAALCLLLAHVLRAVRWALLFPSSSLTRRFDLLLGLGVGYAINLIVPMRIGELVRAAVACRSRETRFSYVVATVAAERLSDLVAVGLFFAALCWRGDGGGVSDWAFPISCALLALAGGVVGVLVRRSARARRVIWTAASLFNAEIRVGVVDAFWAFGEILASRTLMRWRYLAASVAMWATYLIAYRAFAVATGIPTAEVLQAMLAAPLDALALHWPGAGFAALWAPLVLFSAIPILLIVLYGRLREELIQTRALGALRRYGMSGADAPHALRSRFKAASAYEQYLTNLFLGGPSPLRHLEREAIGDGVVLKFFDGGSDATTALVEVGGALRVRKFAVGAAAGKLMAQSDWLAAFERAGAPLAQVIERDRRAGLFRYDMPIAPSARDFFETIHTAPMQRSRALLVDVLDYVQELHRSAPPQHAAPDEIDSYLAHKARQNALDIEDFARRHLSGEEFAINGVLHGFHEWRKLADLDWLRRQARRREVAPIHGDLTIENIIVAPGAPRGFYLIDPNPENIFNTPLIDAAKLMQSLHLGYETLNRGVSCNLGEAGIALPSTRSHRYAELHELLEREIVSRYGEDALREVYFHEMVNYLRLTPYKIRKGATRGLTFFACTNLLLRRYVEQWG
jgi:hypothetical protein